MEGDYRGAETDHVVPGGMKALSRQIFIVSYLQSVEIRHLHVALCSIVYGAAKWSKKPSQTQLCVGDVAAPLKNGSVEPYGSSQSDGCDL